LLLTTIGFATCRRNDLKLNKFIPFNPTDKYTVAYVQHKETGEVERVMKGAPQV
jgi:hypothetical protein